MFAGDREKEMRIGDEKGSEEIIFVLWEGGKRGCVLVCWGILSWFGCWHVTILLVRERLFDRGREISMGDCICARDI